MVKLKEIPDEFNVRLEIAKFFLLPSGEYAKARRGLMQFADQVKAHTTTAYVASLAVIAFAAIDLAFFQVAPLSDLGFLISGGIGVVLIHELSIISENYKKMEGIWQRIKAGVAPEKMVKKLFVNSWLFSVPTNSKK